ncbi:MAG: glycerol-3-phosphate dehydrogenase [Rhodospirillaceae bacterium]|nr:glycerol-3-phosphate dehydrogenase [Rhodospirillaceae bacterium]MBT5895352.1 glycerol-3-phosphate dehydrogenase [Rhodospirillaceae bacterium]MBT7760787.1 glycerol-3-phosphate dehydrogenase [Rhodospirillaceae bacterium]
MPDLQTYDLLVIGGGINGVGIARDATGRGLTVALCEMGDLAGATSSASSKLIHGGLRYLEYFEFRLVREALAEREVLLHIAPHLVSPLRFVLPLVNTIRPAWLVRLGLFFYDHLGPHPSLPNSLSLNLTRAASGDPLRSHIRKGFAYYDCWVDDARLVVANAVSAAELGARIMTDTKLASAHRDGEHWTATLIDRRGPNREVVRARALVNAAGPWVEQVRATADAAAASDREQRTVLIKGSHIIVPRIHDGDDAYILQHTDRRVIFVIPYEGQFSLIGTTDVPFDGDPGEVEISSEEIEYLCAAVNAYFDCDLTSAAVRWSFAGVRPLFGDGSDDPSAVTRDYVLELDTGAEGNLAPLLSIYGGKITTYRRLAEAAMEHLSAHFPEATGDWTAAAPLPGGDLGGKTMEDHVAELISDYRDIPADLIRQLADRHGTLTTDVLGPAKTVSDLGQDFGACLTAREVDYMVANEWARTADDILWRRSKCGLHLNAAQRQAVIDYLE